MRPVLLVAALLASGCDLILPLGGPPPGERAPDGPIADAGVRDAGDGSVDSPLPDHTTDIDRVWKTVHAPDMGTTGPGRLHGPVAVYHGSRATVWLYGGTNQDKVVSDALWEYSDKGWAQLCGPPLAACGPGPRAGHAMVYDTQRDRVLLYGGHDANNVNDPGMADLWAWEADGTTATPVAAAGGPGPRTEAFATYDEDRGVMLLFGGREAQSDSAQLLRNDLHELDGNQWVSPTSAAASPAPRFSCAHSMTYVRKGAAPQDLAGQAVLCGGQAFSSSTGDREFFDDCWAWDGKDWRELCGPCTGTAHMAAGLVHDRLAGRLLMVGGYYWDLGRSFGVEIAGTRSSLDGKAWQQVDPLPTARDTVALAYDPVLHRVLLHGGNGKPCEGDGVFAFNRNCGDTLLYVVGP